MGMILMGLQYQDDFCITALSYPVIHSCTWTAKAETGYRYIWGYAVITLQQCGKSVYTTMSILWFYEQGRDVVAYGVLKS
jgi:hypothetical protein